MRLPALLVLAFAVAGCGRTAGTDSERQDAVPGDPAATPTVPFAPSGPPPPTHPATPVPAGACGVTASARSFSTADALAVALHGLWISCTTDPAPGLCPASDASMFFGALDAPSNPTSRAAACGHLTPHGDGFIRNAAYELTYEVENIAPSGSPPSYVLHVRNDATDRTFVLSYRDDTALTGTLRPTEGTITLGEPDGKIGTLMHSEFTTF